MEQGIENPCVGGSIPPRATKNLNNPLVGLFSFSMSLDKQRVFKSWQMFKANEPKSSLYNVYSI